MLDVIGVSAAAVAIAEMGDKTQLLAILLAGRFRKPWAVIAGIIVATLANHGIAATVGTLVADAVPPQYLRWLVTFGFFATAVWALFPDKDGEESALHRKRWGAFVATTVLFFLVEFGDKTQIATAVLAARYGTPLVVTIGTTLGILIANAPAVVFADRLMRVLPVRALRFAAAGLFVVLGVLTLAT